MYKKAYLVLLLTIAFNVLKPMEAILRPVTIGCQPLEIINELWLDYKPIVYTSMTLLVGGFLVFDYMSKRHRIKKLETEVKAIKENLTSTAVMAHIGKLEKKIDSLEERYEIIEVDLNYLWRFLFTPLAITQDNEMNNKDGPYNYRPHIPQLEGLTIRHIVREVCSLSNALEPFRMKPIDSPRAQFPFAKPPSPTNSIISKAQSRSDSDEEESLKKKKSRRKNSADASDINGKKKGSPREKENSPRKKGDDK